MIISEVLVRKIYLLLLLISFECLATDQPAVGFVPKKQGACDGKIIENIGRNLDLDYFSHPKYGSYPSIENGGLIFSSYCKKLPNNKAITISVFAYDSGVESEKELVLVLSDTLSDKIIASYQEPIPEDAVTEIDENSLSLDTAKYILSSNTRAFGVRINGFMDRCGYEGGYDNQLTLFILDDKKLRPIFSETMSQWHYKLANRCNGEDPPQTYANIVISIEKTSSHGFHDLRLSVISNSMLKSPSVIIKYDGKSYDTSPWRKAFDIWWEKTTLH